MQMYLTHLCAVWKFPVQAHYNNPFLEVSKPIEETKCKNFTLSIKCKHINVPRQLKCCLNIHMKVLPVNTLHITLWCQTCEFDSIWCAVHPCGGHSGRQNIVKAPDHLSNLQQNGPSKESVVSFLALGQISFRSSVLKHFNPLTWMSLMSDKRQTVKTLQSTKCRRLRMAVKNIYCRIHFHCVHVQASTP